MIELIEGTGLWLGKRWGEYFAMVATSIFLPYEIYDLTAKVTVTRVLFFLINLALVLYLVITKRLFGVRGGKRAYEARLRSESIMDSAIASAAAAEPPAPRGPPTVRRSFGRGLSARRRASRRRAAARRRAARQRRRPPPPSQRPPRSRRPVPPMPIRWPASAPHRPTSNRIASNAVDVVTCQTWQPCHSASDTWSGCAS